MPTATPAMAKPFEPASAALLAAPALNAAVLPDVPDFLPLLSVLPATEDSVESFLPDSASALESPAALAPSLEEAPAILAATGAITPAKPAVPLPAPPSDPAPGVRTPGATVGFCGSLLLEPLPAVTAVFQAIVSPEETRYVVSARSACSVAMALAAPPLLCA